MTPRFRRLTRRQLDAIGAGPSMRYTYERVRPHILAIGYTEDQADQIISAHFLCLLLEGKVSYRTAFYVRRRMAECVLDAWDRRYAVEIVETLGGELLQGITHAPGPKATQATAGGLPQIMPAPGADADAAAPAPAAPVEEEEKPKEKKKEEREEETEETEAGPVERRPRRRYVVQTTHTTEYRW